jgi:hypothetical protein
MGHLWQCPVLKSLKDWTNAPTAIVMTRFLGIYDERIFFAEAAGLWVFATFWAVRSYELHLSQYEWNALRGKD